MAKRKVFSIIIGYPSTVVVVLAYLLYGSLWGTAKAMVFGLLVGLYSLVGLIPVVGSIAYYFTAFKYIKPKLLSVLKLGDTVLLDAFIWAGFLSTIVFTIIAVIYLLARKK